tara:strand:+ start:21500 stop:23032 length:1533 start_codon:yes stop_codon:yes gene_type:complete
MRLQELFKQDIDEARGSCWRGYEQKGYKKKGDRNVPNCVKEDINEDRDVTDQELQQLEVYADKMFASLGIDVEFSRHFKDRVNDPRNKKPITIAELTRLFKQIYKKHGKPIAQLGPDAEAVMKDMRTDVNVPFALQWDGKELDLVAKTIMRKPNFATPNPEFAVESAVVDLEKGLVKLDKISYDPVDKLMKKIAKDYDITPKELHNKFKSKHDMIPDAWAKNKITEGKRVPRKKGQPAGSKKHSDLYTDENPKGTIQGLKFATVKDAEASVSKIRGSGKKHAHKIQAAIAMEQRAKAAGKTSAAAVYRKYINSMKKKTKAMKESLVEAYMMDLNQDEDMLILKVKDTDKPGHVEIRGKKNYETDGYDPKDPLHKVLNQLDPATVAKLYGSEEPVFLNPKNPRTEKTIAKAMELMKEHGLVPMYHTMKAYKMTRAKHPDGSAYFKSDYPKTNENFADGKKKGKSRPGRVKRAGASCKGSVTDLRRKAKNSSGEKAKMYHWCANMKSGRKKK